MLNTSEQKGDEIDIIEIDNKIKQNFDDELSKLAQYSEKLAELQKGITVRNLSTRVKLHLQESIDSLSKHVDDVEHNISLNFYIIETAMIIEDYKAILNKPLKINFMGKVSRNNKEKRVLIHSYIEIANKYVDININFNENKKVKITCQECGNSKNFEIEEGNLYICSNCSTQQNILKNVSSYKDINRINISSTYQYDRKIHFRDCINQYGGKQNCFINKEVYDELEEQFELHHLLVGSVKSESQHYRFKNITKEHINMFLKELGYTKHYENINLIHYNLTGIKPDDIGYLEEKLLDDFDVLTKTYDKLYKHLDRKNFINTQYVLYQLLVRHKHPCSKEDFSILKTIDRKNFHDEICQTLFEHIGWSFISFY